MSWIAHAIGRPGTLTLLSRFAAPLFPAAVWRRREAGRTLFLTFDDGPHPTDTPRLLDLLGRFDARASFFHLGSRAAERPDLVRRVVEAGHTVGQHTHTHPDPWRTSPRRLRHEMAEATRVIEDAGGKPICWVRPPYGHLTRPLRRWAEENGQRIAMWDLMPGDFLDSATPETVSDFIVRLARPGSVVVLHEGGRASDVAPAALRAEGFAFAAL